MMPWNYNCTLTCKHVFMVGDVIHAVIEPIAEIYNFLYNAPMPERSKLIEFRGGALDDLRDFPISAPPANDPLELATKRYRDLVKELSS